MFTTIVWNLSVLTVIDDSENIVNEIIPTQLTLLNKLGLTFQRKKTEP